jgi:hypothetical protein
MEITFSVHPLSREPEEALDPVIHRHYFVHNGEVYRATLFRHQDNPTPIGYCSADQWNQFTQNVIVPLLNVAAAPGITFTYRHDRFELFNASSHPVQIPQSLILQLRKRIFAFPFYKQKN